MDPGPAGEGVGIPAETGGHLGAGEEDGRINVQLHVQPLDTEGIKRLG